MLVTIAITINNKQEDMYAYHTNDYG